LLGFTSFIVALFYRVTIPALPDYKSGSTLFRRTWKTLIFLVLLSAAQKNQKATTSEKFKLVLVAHSLRELRPNNLNFTPAVDIPHTRQAVANVDNKFKCFSFYPPSSSGFIIRNYIISDLKSESAQRPNRPMV